MKKTSPTPVNGFHKNCPSCGGLLRYDIKFGRLICTACSTSQPLSIYENPEKIEPEIDVWEYQCSKCGASLHTSGTSQISLCNYCGAEGNFTEKMTRIRRPDKIIPFKITLEDCEFSYRQYAGWQTGKDDPLTFRPVYVPFYRYRETYEGNLVAKDVTEDLSNTASIKYSAHQHSFEARLTVEGELQCASAQFDSETADRLQVETKQIQDFNPAYLCGFYTEAPDLAPNLKESSLNTFALHSAKTEISRKTGKPVLDITLPEKTDESADLILIPVWLMAKRAGQRIIYTAVNGIDGRIIYDKPVSKAKTLGSSIFLSACIFAAMMLLNSLFLLQSNVIIGLCALLASAGYYCIITHLNKHLLSAKVSEKRTEANRCSAPDLAPPPQSISVASYAWPRLLPALLMSICLIPVGILASSSYNAGVFAFTLILCILSIPLLIRSIARSYSISKDIKHGKAHLEKKGSLGEWLLLYGCWPVLAGLFALILISAANSRTAAVDFLLSGKGWLAPVFCIYSAGSLILCLRKTLLDKLEKAMCIIEIIINIAAALLCRFIPEKWFLLSISMLILIPVLLSAIRINMRHNEFISRPIPFFGKKEEAK